MKCLSSVSHEKRASLVMGKNGTLGTRGDRVRSAIRGAAVPSAELPALHEHSLVRAAKEIRDGDQVVPQGASGTIIHMINGGVGI
jgi:hypothetical protein